MKFEKHIFISYAHDDNKPTPDAEGWVTRFHQYLDPYLSIEVGESARIWRDERLRGNELFANEIVKQFPKTAAVVSVVSPRYFKSEWCPREVEEFCKAAQQTGGLTVDDKLRIFAVALKPVPEEMRDKLPGHLSEALGYPFYREVEGKQYERLDPGFGTGEMYRCRIAALARDVAELIQKLECGTMAPAEGPPIRPVVYLAECGYDREEDRQKIWSELRAHGYTVIPEQLSALSDVEPRYVSEVSEMLGRAQLSVHLVGKYGGKTPDGPSRKSVVELQNEIAARESESRGLHRIIWVPEGTQSEVADQQAFIDALQRSAVLQRGADLIAGTLEDCKSAIRNLLKQIEEAASRPEPPPDTTVPTVYLICVEQDLEAAAPVVEYLMAHGLNVELPVFTGDATAVREANEAIAKRANATLLFFGAGDGLWKLHQQTELTRVQGLRRERPMATFTYLSAPRTGDKMTSILKKEPKVINGLSGFDSSALEPVLAAVGAGRNASAQKASS